MKKRSNKLLALFLTAAMTATSVSFTAPVLAEDMDAVQTAETADDWDETSLESDEQFITEEAQDEAETEYADEVEDSVDNEGFEAEEMEGFSDGGEEAFYADFEEGNTDELNTLNDVEIGKAYSIKADTVMVESGKTSGMYAFDTAIVTLQSDGTYLARLHQKSKNRNILAITDDKNAATKHEVTWYMGEGQDGYWFTVPVASLDEPLLFAMGSTGRASKEFGNIVKCTFDVSTIAPSEESPVESSEIVTTQDLTISKNATPMFKVTKAFMAKTGSGQALYITLSGTSYENLFLGTYEEAVANGDNRDNWLDVIVTADGYRFGIPVGEGVTKINAVSISKTKLTDYADGKTTLDKAFYPRQIMIDYEANSISTGDYNDTAALTVKNSVKMFNVESASLHTVAGPNSNNYKETLQLTMGSDAYDKIFVGSAADAEKAESTIGITERKADIVVKANEKGGITVTDYMDKEVTMAFHAVKSGKWFERIVNVNKADKTLTIAPVPVPATTVSLSETEKTVSTGDTFDLTATIEPKDSTDKVTWSSNKETVATVDANGKVTAVKCGTAIITAKAGEYTAQCKVVVSHKEEVLPEVAPTCTKDGWTAGKKCSVCGLILRARKLVKATGHKEEVIPAVEATPGHTGLTEGKKCSVCGEILVAQEVTPALPETAVSVSKINLSANTSTKIAAGKKVQLTAAVAPENADNKAVTWKSSNTKVATVNSNGVVTMKKKAGGKTVTITATAKDGSKVYGSIKLTCMKNAVKKITISGKKTVKVGKTLKLKANVTASSKANKKVAWSSSNTKIATVSSKGVVKAKKKGTVTITVRSLDGTNKKATIKIKVK